MAVTYKKLWHILLDRDMKRKIYRKQQSLQSTQCENLAMTKQSQQILLPRYAER